MAFVAVRDPNSVPRAVRFAGSRFGDRPGRMILDQKKLSASCGRLGTGMMRSSSRTLEEIHKTG